MAEQRPPRKKKKSASASPPPDAAKRTRKKRAEPAPAPTHDKAEEAKATSGLAGKVWLVLLVAGLIEIWLFGRRGHIEVCVAKTGVHDFALLGQPRDEENTRRYPTCEKRYNIGILSKHTEAVDDATLHACRRANILLGKEAIILCAMKEDGWQHRVTEEQCPPWHDHYYQRLFWFLHDKE